MKIVVMGVSGAGKSTVGAGIARALGGRFIDGDSLHAPEAVAKMASGTPLTDEDRWPWLDRVGATLAETEGVVVVACSALRRAYRDRIRVKAGPALRFVFLSGPRENIAERQASRIGHYMPSGLMDSQFRTLDVPVDEPDVIEVSVLQPPEEVIATALLRLSGG